MFKHKPNSHNSSNKFQKLKQMINQVNRLRKYLMKMPILLIKHNKFYPHLNQFTSQMTTQPVSRI